jgi:hypothetical protein
VITFDSINENVIEYVMEINQEPSSIQLTPPGEAIPSPNIVEENVIEEKEKETQLVRNETNKKPKCKKGTRRNKITGLCESIKKGTRRNSNSASPLST